MDLRHVLRRDWLMLNSGAVRNALVASAQATQRAAERAEVERSIAAAQPVQLRRAL